MIGRIAVVTTALFTASCGLQGQGSVAPDPAYVAAQRAALENPPTRFVVAGKREYVNGTEIYVLDGKSGQVCYYFVAKGGDTQSPKDANTDMRACAGEALNPL